MSDVSISLLSGLVGVIVGSFIQIVFAAKTEIKKAITDYIKLFCIEWLKLSGQAQALLIESENYNYMIFNLYIKEKANLLGYLFPLLEKDEENLKKIQNIQKQINKKSQEFSLNPYLEGALTKDAEEKDKKLFLVELSQFINDIHEELSSLTI